MIEPKNPVMTKMLDRLFASMVNGPSMNCRPHASRQRVDLAGLLRLRDIEPGAVLLGALGESAAARIVARVPAAKVVANRPFGGRREEVEEDDEATRLTPEERAARQAWSDQQSLLNKLRVIADDARTYEQDTGVHVLDIGFPLLNLPPGSFGGRAGATTRRVLAPIAFIPVTLIVKTGAKQTVEIACRGEGVDRVRPNVALLAWLEQQTGQPMADLFADEAGEDPWREVAELVRAVAARVELDVPELFKNVAMPSEIALVATPRSDDDETQGKSIVCSAVLGLFPTSNQGLLRDTREMVTTGAPEGPIESFVRLGDRLTAPSLPTAEADEVKPDVEPDPVASDSSKASRRSFESERLVSQCDPCQSRAVRLARECRGLVIHGPPGTGKSQTIANIIGDHLARGERVLFVCDKRTALDVVADRLQSIGVGNLLATVHDPQRDQREFYRSVREQLDNLVDAPVDEKSDDKLARVDKELQTLHDELSNYYKDLMGRGGGPGSFHHLMGQWLSEQGSEATGIDERSLQQVPAADFERHSQRLKEVLERGENVGHADNPWVSAAGVDLATFLATPMNSYKSVIDACVAAAASADANIDPQSVPFGPTEDLVAEGERRRSLAEELEKSSPFPIESAKKWTSQTAPAIKSALEQLKTAAESVRAIGQSPLDPVLAAIAFAGTSSDVASADEELLDAYAAAFRAKWSTFTAARAAAGEGTEPIVIAWMNAPEAKVIAARKRLEGALPLADAVEGSALDASLLARFAAAPIDSSTLINWLAALNGYLDIARKWHAMFHPGAKKAAQPAVAHFGLSLNADSAEMVKKFLQDAQKREDLKNAVESATGKRFVDRPDDGELLTTFRQHHAILKSLAAPSQQDASPDTKRSDEITAAINALVSAQLTAVQPLLTRYQLPATSQAAQRLSTFLSALKLRTGLADRLNQHILPAPLGWPLPDDRALTATHEIHTALLDLLDRFPPETPLGKVVAAALTEGDERRASVIASLRRAPERARILTALERTVDTAGLFSKTLKGSVVLAGRSNHFASEILSPLVSRLDTLEGVLRIADGLKRLPDTLSAAATTLLAQRCPAADGYSVVRRNVLAGEITDRLRQNPNLQGVDGHRLEASFERFRKLSERKKELVRDDIVHQWTSKQKERLLAATGSRLNGLGADLRRRLTMRGERAMRLRQVIAHGKSVEGGDPLFDLRPVWMASPETVAQLFAREPIFDVIVFDEASQCRLEEALPVLTRGKRIVIAGDPKQLPPTRFFESTISTSEDAVDAESEQELFEVHQGEVEDLLTAALSMEGIDESYLNVHYRSRNSDLIGFSNEHFYGSRLQAIPGHPKNRIRYAPITLYRADGVYEKRRNSAEAEAVCTIVHDLLRRATPPSIGIACFNMVQRDLIVETLEEWAERDEEFAARLAEARERRGHGSFEGLFVKNLENVQGDERDHLIISTTYGPDKAGKFRRSFGPLGTAGGGRRLNVLITRAREEVHIVTSIPRAAYSSLPEIPPGTIPGGSWLLFAYLAFAENLKDEYETVHRILEASGPAQQGTVHVKPSKSPSQFAKALGNRLAKSHNASSEVHWGNDGFCIDLAMLHPTKAEDVTIGVQCDMTRFAGSDDPVEWDTFETGIHEDQGWTIHRVWTPHFFRDPNGITAAVAEKAARAATVARGAKKE